MGCAQLPASGTPFGVLGDTPYSEAEAQRLDLLIDDMNAERLAFVVHVGDIGASRTQSCTEPWLQARKRQFARLRHPFVLLPGDNEWSDCPDPLVRLARWRTLFCFEENIRGIERQVGPYCEHMRWIAGEHVFVTLNVPGHDNNVRHAEHEPRMRAVYAWLEEAAKLAEGRAGLVILMQANPFLTLPRDGFVGLRERLAELGRRMPYRVTLIHGDTHFYRDDEPFPGLRRIEVWGAPLVSWIPMAIEGRELRSNGARHR